MKLKEIKQSLKEKREKTWYIAILFVAGYLGLMLFNGMILFMGFYQFLLMLHLKNTLFIAAIGFVCLLFGTKYLLATTEAGWNLISVMFDDDKSY